MTTITRRLEFDAGHRVLGHEGKCRFLHGHRYVAEISVTAPELDTLGRVIDFGVIKERVGGWIDRNWDHNLLLNRDDPQLLHIQNTEELQPFVFDGNPTAENIAEVLYGKAMALLPRELEVVLVRIYETPNSFADFSGFKR